MIMSSLFEKVFLKKDDLERRSEIDRQLHETREELARQQTQFKGEVRQHRALAETSSRLMNTMTHAMIMMESGSAQPEKQ